MQVTVTAGAARATSVTNLLRIWLRLLPSGARRLFSWRIWRSSASKRKMAYRLK